jgi:hypothetical protein
MSARVAYISQGKLYIAGDSAEPRPVESEFANAYVQSSLEIHQRHEWKTAHGEGTPFSGRMLWGIGPSDPLRVQIAFTAVACADAENRLMYMLQTERVGGIFTHDLASGSEKRVLHREGFRGSDLHRHPETGYYLFSQQFANGTANIMLTDENAVSLRELTEGDSVDLAASWVPGTPGRMVYQSAGVGRNAQGFPVCCGPASIEELDLQSGQTRTLRSDEQYDYLLPHVDSDGRLLCIRRPYQVVLQRTLLQLCIDALLFPVRLIRALFMLLNFLSAALSSKPLITPSGARPTAQDQATVMLRGKMVDAERALRRQKDPEASLVPANWELIRVNGAGDAGVLARNVAAFDLCADKSVVYTNGSTIYRLAPDGSRKTLVRGKLIQEVIAL